MNNGAADYAGQPLFSEICDTVESDGEETGSKYRSKQGRERGDRNGSKVLRVRLLVCASSEVCREIPMSVLEISYLHTSYGTAWRILLCLGGGSTHSGVG